MKPFKTQQRRPGMDMPRAPKTPFKTMGKAPSFMADGDFGEPEPVTGSGHAPESDGQEMDPDQDGDVDSPAIKPEVLHYHDEPQNCGMCMYRGTDGMCEILKMDVGEESGCVAFEHGGQGGGEEQGEFDMPEEQDEEQPQGKSYADGRMGGRR